MCPLGCLYVPSSHPYKKFFQEKTIVIYQKKELIPSSPIFPFLNYHPSKSTQSNHSIHQMCGWHTGNSGIYYSYPWNTIHKPATSWSKNVCQKLWHHGTPIKPTYFDWCFWFNAGLLWCNLLQYLWFSWQLSFQPRVGRLDSLSTKNWTWTCCCHVQIIQRQGRWVWQQLHIQCIAALAWIKATKRTPEGSERLQELQ